MSNLPVSSPVNPFVFSSINSTPIMTVHSNELQAAVISSESGLLKIDDGVTLDYPILNLIDMYIFQGKNMDDNQLEYVEQILKHPSIENDNFKAIAAYKRFRKFMEGRV